MRPKELLDYQEIQSINSRCILIGKKDPKISSLLPHNRIFQYVYSYSIMGEDLHKTDSAYIQGITLGEILLDYININCMYGIDRPVLREKRKLFDPKILQFCDNSYHDLLSNRTLFSNRYKIDENPRKERKAAIEFLDHELIHSVYDLELALAGDVLAAALMTKIYPKSIMWKYFDIISLSSRFTSARFIRERSSLLDDFNSNKTKYLDLIKSKRTSKNPYG